MLEMAITPARMVKVPTIMVKTAFRIRNPSVF
jgi:hypothetical protein